MIEPTAVQPPDQLRYARVLGWGTWIGAGVLLASFVAYLTGLVGSQVAPARLPALWGQPVARFLQLSGMPAGWGWLRRAYLADVAGLTGIAILAGTSIAGLLAVLPLYAARRDRVFVALCLADAAVLIVAAVGWPGGVR